MKKLICQINNLKIYQSDNKFLIVAPKKVYLAEFYIYEQAVEYCHKNKEFNQNRNSYHY